MLIIGIGEKAADLGNCRNGCTLLIVKEHPSDSQIYLRKSAEDSEQDPP
jgi:hypothetical protein